MKALTKEMIVILFAILIHFQSYSQTDKKFVASADNLKILYLGIDNPVSIAAEGFSSDKLKVTISNASISGSNGKYMVKPAGSGIAVLNLMAVSKQGETIKLGSDTFLIKRIPSPVACIGNYKDANVSISKDELLKNAKVDIFTDLPFELKAEVVSYVCVFKHGDEISKFSVFGSKFSQEAKNMINKMNSGDVIFVEDIKYKTIDGFRYAPQIIVKLL